MKELYEKIIREDHHETILYVIEAHHTWHDGKMWTQWVVRSYTRETSTGDYENGKTLMYGKNKRQCERYCRKIGVTPEIDDKFNWKKRVTRKEIT